MYELTIINPGAETGDTSGWTNLVGSIGVKSASPSPHEGSYFFYGGANASTDVYQDIDLRAQKIPVGIIDAGSMTLFLDWYQSDYAVDDYSKMYVEFYDVNQSLISSFNPGYRPPRAAQTWERAFIRRLVPANTRFIRLHMAMDRNDGTNNDGYVDSITASLRNEVYNLDITNHDASSDLTGWTDELGGLAVTSAPAKFFYGGSNLETIASQELDLSTTNISFTKIDSGDGAILIEWMQSTADTDEAEITLRFLNSGKGTISTYAPGLATVSTGLWHYKSYITTIPANTRYIDILQHMYRNDGTTNNGHIDDIAATAFITKAPAPSRIFIQGQAITTEVFSTSGGGGAELMLLGTAI